MSELCFALPFQVVGAQFLAARRQALLADDMGVGKSCQAVTACDLVGARNILVLVPATARVNWLREFDKFSPFGREAVAVLDGKTAPAPAGVTVCSYDMLTASKKLRQSLLARQWDVLILDEAHSVKNRASQRTQAVYGRRCDGLGGLAAVSDRVWRLTGTPVCNYVDELWPHLRSAGIYPGNYYDFVATFCTGFDSDYGFRITGTKNEAKLKTLLEGFMLRRKKEQVMPELPPLTFKYHSLSASPVDIEAWLPEAVGLTPETFYAQLEEKDKVLTAAFQLVREKNGHGTLDGALKVIEQMAPNLGALRRWVGLSKVPAYVNLISDELRSGRIEKIVIGAYHVVVVKMLMELLKEFRPVCVFGDTPADKRHLRVDKFQDNPKCRVFVGNMVSASTAITLTRSCRVDILEASWRPDQNAQFVMRVHRMGQQHPVHARFFGVENSIDKQITLALRRKTEQIAKVIE